MSKDKSFQSTLTEVVAEKKYRLIKYRFGIGIFYGILIEEYIFSWEMGTADTKPLFNKFSVDIEYDEVESTEFFHEVGKIISGGYVLNNRKTLDEVLFDFYTLATMVTDGKGDKVLESELLERFKVKLENMQNKNESQYSKMRSGGMVCTFVGSRDAPQKAESLGIDFLKLFLANGNDVWSGGSGVMDKCVEHAYYYNKFRQIPQGKIKVFLPWGTFDKKVLYPGLDKSLYIDISTHPIQSTARNIAKEHYDKYNQFDGLKPGAQSLMTRNSCQVLDETCDHLSNFLMCWAKPANSKNMSVQGGTNLAVSIAKNYGIPVLNLYHPWVFEAVSAHVDGFLPLVDLIEVYGE